jgi:aspartyl-tRNA(Asn)/glutamyl-tRNA(Gln) amidotransferase subunit A
MNTATNTSLPADCLDMTLVQAAQAIRDKSISSVELTRAALDRAHALQARFKAFIRIDEEQAMAAAQRCDALSSGAELRGPLHGVPLAHKDMFYRQGEVSTCGSGLRKNWVAPVTATVLERLDRAGAIQIGTLHMTEFAYGPSGQNATLGDALNPWNPDYIPGGSSSGPGIATATRTVFGALGSDTAGSVRMPAHLCGVTGMKTTHGLIPVKGCMPLSASLDAIGPLTRTVQDNALMLAVMAGMDDLLPAHTHAYIRAAEQGTSGDLTGLRIGLPVGYFDRQLNAEVAQRWNEMARQLASLGAQVVPVAMPDLDAINAAGVLLTWGDVVSLHGEQMRERHHEYSAQTRGRLQSALAINERDYLNAQRYRGIALREFCAGVFSRCDALLAPMLSFPAPRLSEVDVTGGAAMANILEEMTRLVRPANMLGLPALALPAGFTCNGMPCGMQLLARPFGESLLYRIGAAFQSASHWHTMAPPLRHAEPATATAAVTSA